MSAQELPGEKLSMSGKNRSFRSSLSAPVLRQVAQRVFITPANLVASPDDERLGRVEFIPDIAQADNDWPIMTPWGDPLHEWLGDIVYGEMPGWVGRAVPNDKLN